ncbi:MAG: protein-tyrosine-phosphatase [Candidatus Methylacidiphilales bacterium]
MNLYNNLQKTITKLELEFDLIPESRKQELKDLAKIINESMEQFGRADLTVICTHNSRRSQLGQLWLKVSALHYGIKNIYTFSGGTEATAFNIRMVNALKDFGFDVNAFDETLNPKYHIKLGENDDTMDILYSKVYNESYNPQQNFIAIMVCNSADKGCPLVAGAFKRISLPYLDPKTYDDTDLENEKYLEKVSEMGREMLFVFKQLQ